MADNLENRIKLFETEFKTLLDKHNLSWSVSLDFPKYKVLPPEVKLSLVIIDKEGGEYKLAYLDKQK